MNPVVVVARLRPAPGRTEQLAALLADLTSVVHMEPGCALYAAHRDTDSGDFVYVEQYDDQAAFAAHASGPALDRFRPRLLEVIDGEIEVAVLEPLGWGDPTKSHIRPTTTDAREYPEHRNEKRSTS